MNYEIVELEEKVVVGLSDRIDMAHAQMGEKIGNLWGKLYKDEEYKKIKNRKTEYGIGLYSDYEGSVCTLTVGNEVVEAANKGFESKVIPSGKYAKFTIHGHMVHSVAEAWQKICSMDLDRRFTGDFEEYLNCDFENADVNIYIALK